MVPLRAGLLATALLAVPCHAQQFLTNPGFENGLTGWSAFGNAFHEAAYPPQFVPQSGNGLVSLFGTGGAFNVSGIFQSFPASPGQVFTMDAWSRHWGGDPLTGYGPPGDNWMIMKMAFFNSSQTEIGGVEATILDGSFPTDVWIDNAPIMGTAPAGTVEVQALILFLQPAAGLGAGHVDDIFFTGPTSAPVYPGTNEGLLMATGVGGNPISGGSGNYIKPASAGQIVEFNVSSLGTKYHQFPYWVAGQVFSTGSPPAQVIPGLSFNIFQPVFFLVTVVPSPLGAAVISPVGGTSTFFTVPPGLTGMSLMMHALVPDPTAGNGVFATSDGYEIQFQ